MKHFRGESHASDSEFQNLRHKINTHNKWVSDLIQVITHTIPEFLSNYVTNGVSLFQVVYFLTNILHVKHYQSVLSEALSFNPLLPLLISLICLSIYNYSSAMRQTGRICQGWSRFSPGFLPQARDIWWTGDSKLTWGVNVSVYGCLSLYVSLAKSQRPVQGGPKGSWDWLQLLQYSIGRWMDVIPWFGFYYETLLHENITIHELFPPCVQTWIVVF